MTEVEINALRIIVVIVLIFTILAFLRKKNTNPSNIYKFIFGIVLINLILTIINPAYSFINMLSFDSIEHQSFFDTLNTPNNKLNIDYWSIRGQIGDVLSGHFTALAFIGLLASLELQRESIKQIENTILLNTRAINLQKEEIKNQKIELEITKIHNEFRFYYEELNILNNNLVYFTNTYNKGFHNLLSDFKITIAFVEIDKLKNILDYYQFIFNQINNIKEESIKINFLNYFKLYSQHIYIDYITQMYIMGRLFHNSKVIKYDDKGYEIGYRNLQVTDKFYLKKNDSSIKGHSWEEIILHNKIISQYQRKYFIDINSKYNEKFNKENGPIDSLTLIYELTNHLYLKYKLNEEKENNIFDTIDRYTFFKIQDNYKF